MLGTRGVYMPREYIATYGVLLLCIYLTIYKTTLINDRELRYSDICFAVFALANSQSTRMCAHTKKRLEYRAAVYWLFYAVCNSCTDVTHKLTHHIMY